MPVFVSSEKDHCHIEGEITRESDTEILYSYVRFMGPDSFCSKKKVMLSILYSAALA